jgi:hypothetical protein
MDEVSLVCSEELIYVLSWKADPLAWAIDAFTLQWKNFIFYAFPPFSLIDRVCQKVLIININYGRQSRTSRVNNTITTTLVY